MKKGFTLIELLAVIVILAIIALIATPIVLSIISDSKESSGLRSAEMYLDSVEYGIADVIMDNKTIQNGTHTIMENGNICIGTYNDKKCTGDVVEVEVNGETPKEGSTVTIEEGKIKDINLLYGDKTVIKDSKGNLVYGELGSEEEEEPAALEAGLYDENDVLVASWEELVDYKTGYGFDIGLDYNYHPPIYNGSTGDIVQEAYFTYGFTMDGGIYYIYPFSMVIKNNNLQMVTKLIIPDNVTAIGEYAFAISDTLKSITIPKTITNISLGAFEGCVNLKTINYFGTKADWNSIIFEEEWNGNCPEITVRCTDGDIVIPANN